MFKEPIARCPLEQKKGNSSAQIANGLKLSGSFRTSEQREEELVGSGNRADEEKLEQKVKDSVGRQ